MWSQGYVAAQVAVAGLYSKLCPRSPWLGLYWHLVVQNPAKGSQMWLNRDLECDLKPWWWFICNIWIFLLLLGSGSSWWRFDVFFCKKHDVQFCLFFYLFIYSSLSTKFC
jgi:hypothetical protein